MSCCCSRHRSQSEDWRAAHSPPAPASPAAEAREAPLLEAVPWPPAQSHERLLTPSKYRHLNRKEFGLWSAGGCAICSQYSQCICSQKLSRKKLSCVDATGWVPARSQADGAAQRQPVDCSALAAPAFRAAAMRPSNNRPSARYTIERSTSTVHRTI